jgi:hypothetical protein
MENNNQQKSLTIPPIYYLETILKAVFIPMAIFNLPFTIAIALAASLCGLLRMLKRPQFNK